MAPRPQVALTSEYSPKRVRASFVLAIYCCFSLGFVLAGAVAGWIMPIYGWRSAFLVGALAPLVLVPLLLWNLPESMAFLLRRRGDHAAVYALCRKIDRTMPAVEAPQVSYESAASGKRVSVRALFAPSQIVGTVLLWIVFASNLGMFYALQSWLPPILEDRHLPTAVVVTATSLTTIGGIAIAFVVGSAMDRLGAYGALGTLYFAGCAFLAFAAFGLGAPVWVLFIASFLLGCSISGGQKSVIPPCRGLLRRGAVHRRRLGPRHRPCRQHRRPSHPRRGAERQLECRADLPGDDPALGGMRRARVRPRTARSDGAGCRGLTGLSVRTGRQRQRPRLNERRTSGLDGACLRDHSDPEVPMAVTAG